MPDTDEMLIDAGLCLERATTASGSGTAFGHQMQAIALAIVAIAAHYTTKER